MHGIYGKRSGTKRLIRAISAGADVAQGHEEQAWIFTVYADILDKRFYSLVLQEQICMINIINHTYVLSKKRRYTVKIHTYINIYVCIIILL